MFIILCAIYPNVVYICLYLIFSKIISVLYYMYKITNKTLSQVLLIMDHQKWTYIQFETFLHNKDYGLFFSTLNFNLFLIYFSVIIKSISYHDSKMFRNYFNTR